MELPKPHADGTPIQPSELPSSLPGYLICLIPLIKKDLAAAVMGTVIGALSTAFQKISNLLWELF